MLDSRFTISSNIQILENLRFEETVEVIRRNLEWESRDDILANFVDMRSRLQALYRMTGGNPRLIMMLYEVDRPRVGHQGPKISSTCCSTGYRRSIRIG